MGNSRVMRVELAGHTGWTRELCGLDSRVVRVELASSCELNSRVARVELAGHAGWTRGLCGLDSRGLVGVGVRLGCFSLGVLGGLVLPATRFVCLCRWSVRVPAA